MHTLDVQLKNLFRSTKQHRGYKIQRLRPSYLVKNYKFKMILGCTVMGTIAGVGLLVTYTYASTFTPNTNLLSNPGFETWTNGLPTGWIKYGVATTLTKSTDVHSGKYSVKISTTSKTAVASGISDGTTPTVSSTIPGITYTASCWAKASKAVTVDIALHETKQNGTSVSAASITALAVTSTTKWYQFQVSHTTTGSGDRLPLSIYANTSSTGATFELDDCSLMAADTTPPTAPTNLSATVISPTQVNLNWTASSDNIGVTGYYILRNNVVIGTIAAGTTAYTDMSVNPGTAYSYSVAAYDAAGNKSAASSSVLATTPFIPPSAPTNLTVTATSPVQIDLSWTASTPGSGSITGYQVTCNGLVLATVAGTTYDYTTASPNTLYSCSVAVVDSNLLTNQSSIATATTPALVAPTAPTNLTVTATSPVQIDLSWTASTPGSGSITGYQVTCNGSLLATVAGINYDYMSASPNTQYSCSVAAIDSYSSISSASNVATDTTPLNYTSPYSLTDWDTALSSVVHADVTQSVTLPSGNILWIFGDTTQVNGVSTVGGYGYPHDSFVTQSPGTLNFTAVPGSYGYGWQQVPNWSDGTFFWMSTPVVDQGVLYIIGERIQASGSSFSVVGNYVASFNAQTLAFESITPVSDGATGGTLWSGVTAAPGGWWITGTHEVTCSYVTDCDVGDAAFVPTGDLANSSDWQVTSDIIPASYNIGNDLTAVMVSPTDWVMYTKFGGPYGGTQIEQLTGTSISGPWTVTGEWSAPSPTGTVTYGSSLHLEQASPAGQVLLSYNVNGGTSSQYHALFEYLPLP